jgi:hypothetical protein
MLKYIISMLIIPAFLTAEESDFNSLDYLDYFIGNWESEVTGKAGLGKGMREYSYIMGESFLLAKNKAVFEPQEKNPEGEIHEDWGFFSYDNNREVLIFRQFHNEGFINQYVIDTLVSNDSILVFNTEIIENAPSGMRARLTVKIDSINEFLELFELAFPGKGFGICIENRWTRIE